MPRRFLLSGFFLILSLCVFAQKKQYKVIAIGFYNCENFFDTVHDTAKQDEDFTPNGSYHYTEEVYKQKVHNIASVFEKMGTDVTPDGPAIIGMAEVENSTPIKDVIIQPNIIARHYNYVWFPTPDVRGISVAMIYNPKYFTVLGSRPVHVPVESIGWTRPTRDVLHVYGILAGDTVHVLVNHWPSKSGGEAETNEGRRVAAGVDKKIIDSLTKDNPNVKILIMGDLNDNPTSDGVMKVIKAKADKETIKLTDIYNPWINMYNKGMGTESYRGEWNLIDQIMMSGAFLDKKNEKWKFYKAEIFNRPFLVNKIGNDKGLPHRSFTVSQVWDNGYSDHFPVLVYLIE